MSEEPDWKLKLRYGQTATPFKHYSLLADGKLVEDNPDFGVEKGPAVMGMKVWAVDPDQAADMIIALSNAQNFKMAGKIEVYETEPDRPPEDKPFGYSVKFTPYDEELFD